MAHEEIRSEQVFKRPAAPFSLATRTTGGTLLHVSGQVALGLDGDTVGRGDIERQTIQVLENIKALVEAAGGTLSDVARIVVYLTTREHLPTVLNVRRRYSGNRTLRQPRSSLWGWHTRTGWLRSRPLRSCHEPCGHHECINLDEAIDIAATHPMARFGRIEIRPFWHIRARQAPLSI